MAFSALAELTARAQTLTSAGDLVGAHEVLAAALNPPDVNADADADADPGQADAELALASALYARILIALGDPHSARPWAGFAHAAEERLHGPHHERTLAAAATHAAVLHRVGHYGHATRVYQQLVDSLYAIDGDDSPRALAASADLAVTEHAAGHCTSARARLTDVWIRFRYLHGDAAPAGIKMLARLGAAERDCGRDAEANGHLALAQQLCARHLPADHPLVRQAAALALAPASGRHRCGQVTQSVGPEGPTAPALTPALPPAGAPMVPHPRRPPELHRVDSDSATPAHPDRADDWATPAHPDPADDSATPAHPDHVEGTADELPLPVPLERPVRPEPTSRPVLMAAVLISAVAVAIAVLALTFTYANGVVGPVAGTTTATTGAGPSAAAPQASSAPPAAHDPGPPTNLKLRDNHDSVALTWAYPRGAEGPVLISGGRQGQQLRVFQQLAAGTADYIVYGLNEGVDYCFTIAVAYSTDRIAATSPVCTRR